MYRADAAPFLATVKPDFVPIEGYPQQGHWKGVEGRHLKTLIAVRPRSGEYQVDIPTCLHEHGSDDAETVAPAAAKALTGGICHRYFTVPAFYGLHQRLDQGIELLLGRLADQHLPGPFAELWR